MHAIISTRGLTISTTYKNALTARLGKLERMLPDVGEARIVLSREKHRRTAALTLAARRRTFRSEETAADLETAVDAAVDALVRQVREAKDRVKNRKARNAPRRAPGPLAAARPAAEIVARRVPLKPMSLEEAVDQLRKSSAELLVFADAGTDSVSVLYRRPDGALELIEPVA
jgi:putative sigma-54 modulation protein